MLTYFALDNIYLQVFGVRIIEIGGHIVLISILYGLSMDGLILLIIKFNKSWLNELRNEYKDKKSLLRSKIKGIGIILFVILLFIFSALLTFSI